MWATALALAALELWYSGDASQREAWALIARRATAWLTYNGAGERQNQIVMMHAV